ncbi:MAG: DEAD/DEAH box helicase [Pseudomonadales bacterium]|jgi:ATP-dependent RNA helicase RhlE|nr:DEAD/DEAH box helicase [Pseudomonadales bacterium]
MSAFQDLGLMAELVRAVADEGYATPTPVQARAIPTVLEGRDLMAAAQTGTGKTAGFTLPMLQRLMKTRPEGRRHVRALVVVPTRELCAQVAESVRTYGAHLPLRAVTIFGGVGMHPQIKALQRGADIVIATPGRLLDLAGQKAVDLSRVEILVLDEADRMLDMGFIHDIKRVLALLPKQRQNLLFSATFAPEIRALAQSMLQNPAQIDVAPRNSAAETVRQLVYPVEASRKSAALAHLVREGNWYQCLVFTRTKHGANRLAQKLDKAGLEAEAIHGNKSQNARTRALEGFKSGRVRVLVATDIAARGIDIDGLPHVVNFDLPHVPEDYVHRIGRTGRAGAEGEAVSLVSPEERKQLRAIEKLIARDLPRAELQGFAADLPADGPGDRAHQGPRAGGRGQGGGQRGRGQGGGQRRGQGGGQGGGNRGQGGQRRGRGSEAAQARDGGSAGGAGRRRRGGRNRSSTAQAS